MPANVSVLAVALLWMGCTVGAQQPPSTTSAPPSTAGAGRSTPTAGRSTNLGLPPLDTPLTGGDLGWHYHTGGHAATAADWKAFLEFLGKYFK